MAIGLPTTIELEIVTPDRLLFQGEVEEVTVPSVNGYLGILPGHAPMISELRVGVIAYRQGANRTHLFCGWGFVEVLPRQVAILAEVAKAPEELDLEQAQAQKEQAEQLLRSKDQKTDYRQALALLEEAMVRIEVAEKS